jgi:hypothetical protein
VKSGQLSIWKTVYPSVKAMPNAITKVSDFAPVCVVDLGAPFASALSSWENPLPASKV